MESALTPREIQDRIRGGMALDMIAAEAGVTVEHVEIFAKPVLAERQYACDTARQSGLRGHGDRTLTAVVEAALAAHDIDAKQISWDAWRGEERVWTIAASWGVQVDEPTLYGEEFAQALFSFDMRSRVSVPSNDEAKNLVDTRNSRSNEFDDEPTVDLRDQVAIVKAVQDDARPPAVVADDRSDSEVPDPDDYMPAEFAEVDGLFDIVPNPQGDMDVLYDMLAGFNEDSVRIYTGLTRPVATPAAADPGSETQAKPAAKHQPTEKKPVAEAEPEHPDVEPSPAPKNKTKRKRASVPTWDEIVFGSPKT